MTALLRLTRVELLKLTTTRTTRLSVLGGLAFAALLGYANASLAGTETNPELGTSEWVRNVVGVSTIPAVVGLLLGVLLSAGEHQHRTITTTLLVTPRRSRAMAAKLGAAMVAGPVVAVAMIVVSAAVAAPFVVAEGASVDAVDREVGVAILGALLATTLLAAMGVVLGMLLRSQVASTVAVAAWALIVEGVLDVLTGGGLRRWLPGGAAADLAGSGGQTAWMAALVLAGWTAAGAAVAIPAVVRRDVG